MTDKQLYQEINGEPVVSTAGMALLMDVDEDALRAEIQRQRAAGREGLALPPEWIRRGHRVRKEVQLALGYEPGMKEALDYLAERNGLAS